jgi:hypothetical protein
MKFLWILLITIAFLNADETQRLEAILKDISNLRTSYEVCESKLEALGEERDSSQDFRAKEREYEKKIATLENKILVQNALLSKKTRDSSAKKAKQTLSPKCEETNPFPKLLMKEKYAAADTEDKIETFKASAFRLNETASIYDGPNGKKIDAWEKDTSFTSDRKTKNMIEITGYFVNKLWSKSTKAMWVESKYASKR